MFLNFSQAKAKLGTPLIELYRFTSFAISLERGKDADFLSSENNLTKLILQTGCPSNHLTSKRKSALIQTPSVQISEAFHQHHIVEMTKKYLGINALLLPIV